MTEFENDQTQESESDIKSNRGEVNHSRRSFLSLVPLGVFGAISLTFATASKRVLSPQTSSVDASKKNVEMWMSLGLLSELSGDEPIERAVTMEKQAGWTKTIEEQIVFVLPKHNHKVLSSVCPHEGCPVLWDSEKKNFVCPCHDSFFSDSGKLLTGPANSDLIELTNKVEDGKLQIKLVS